MWHQQGVRRLPGAAGGHGPAGRESQTSVRAMPQPLLHAARELTRIVVLDPDVILMDEPFGPLDASTQLMNAIHDRS
jgi:hypothetical protein